MLAIPNGSSNLPEDYIILPEKPKRQPKPKAKLTALPKLIPAPLVAKQLGIDRGTVYAMIRDGRLKGHQLGRSWQVDEASVLAYLERTEYRPVPARGRRRA